MRCKPAATPKPSAQAKPSQPSQSLQLLTPDEVASILNVSRVLVIRGARAKKIPGFKYGKSWLFRQSTIEQWIAEQERG